MYVSAFFSIVGNAQFVAATYRLFKVLNSSETVASRVTYKGMSNSEPKSIKTPKGRRSKGDEKQLEKVKQQKIFLLASRFLVCFFWPNPRKVWQAPIYRLLFGAYALVTQV